MFSFAAPKPDRTQWTQGIHNSWSYWLRDGWMHGFISKRREPDTPFHYNIWETKQPSTFRGVVETFDGERLKVGIYYPSHLRGAYHDELKFRVVFDFRFPFEVPERSVIDGGDTVYVYFCPRGLDTNEMKATCYRDFLIDCIAVIDWLRHTGAQYYNITLEAKGKASSHFASVVAAHYGAIQVLEPINLVLSCKPQDILTLDVPSLIHQIPGFDNYLPKDPSKLKGYMVFMCYDWLVPGLTAFETLRTDKVKILKPADETESSEGNLRHVRSRPTSKDALRQRRNRRRHRDSEMGLSLLGNGPANDSSQKSKTQFTMTRSVTTSDLTLLLLQHGQFADNLPGNLNTAGELSEQKAASKQI